MSQVTRAFYSIIKVCINGVTLGFNALLSSEHAG